MVGSRRRAGRVLKLLEIAIEQNAWGPFGAVLILWELHIGERTGSTPWDIGETTLIIRKIFIYFRMEWYKRVSIKVRGLTKLRSYTFVTCSTVSVPVIADQIRETVYLFICLSVCPGVSLQRFLSYPFIVYHSFTLLGFLMSLYGYAEKRSRKKGFQKKSPGKTPQDKKSPGKKSPRKNPWKRSSRKKVPGRKVP